MSCISKFRFHLEVLLKKKDAEMGKNLGLLLVIAKLIKLEAGLHLDV